MEALRSELAKCTDSSNEQQISRDLMGAERRVRTLQEQLQAITANNNNCNTLPSSPNNNNGLLDVQVRWRRVFINCIDCCWLPLFFFLLRFFERRGALTHIVDLF